MRINHNITAMNSYRNFSANTSKVSKNLEKVSTGLRINRAGDDAAGLAISEKMRVQISGLEAATKNAKDGISLVQTAEGAMTEIHDMLNRMVQLTEQSANGTYDDSVDRTQLQKEVEALKTEIDRIADSTNYNGIKLLDGSLSSEGVASAAANSVDISKIGNAIESSAQSIDATKGVYETDELIANNKTGLNNGDKWQMTVRYQDGEGNEQTKTLTLRVADNTVTTSSAIVLDDGTEKGKDLGISFSGNAGEATQSEIANMALKAIEQDEDLNSAFQVQTSAGDGTATYNAGGNGLTFTAREGGTSGAKLIDFHTDFIKIGHNVSETDTVDAQVAVSASRVQTVTEAVDAGKAYDLSKAKVWDGTQGNLADSIFEINGEKFVFASAKVSATGDLTDEQKTMLSEAGVGNNVVIKVAKNATDGKTDEISAANIQEMQQKIEKATGLKTTRYSATVAAGGKVSNVVLDGTGSADTAPTTATSSFTDATAGPRTSFVKFDVPKSLAAAKTAKGGLTLQIGDTSDVFNKLTVSIEDMHSKSIGIGNVDISTQEGASKAIDEIKSAVNFVSNTRGTMGALQNRLDHTINNLGVMRENIQSSESLIRDTDVAEEMMNYTKNNILNQSAQAMLAQANQLPQGVLQLLG